MKKLIAALLISTPLVTVADNVILDDQIVDGSQCVGFDCVNGESFGFDTLRLKENNIRINIDDTSSSGSFPSNDWRLVFNDSSNGGASYFAVEDSTAGKTPFKVEAAAPSNTLFVESTGDVGIGTANPVVKVHTVDGDSPTLRLEQDGSSGFTPQTWDMAGNETNFFIRDVTNGSKLPFRIQPNSPESSIYIRSDGVAIGQGTASAQLDIKSASSTRNIFRTRASDNTVGLTVHASGNIGVGTESPDANLHVQDSSGVTQIHIEENHSDVKNGRVLLQLSNNGSPRLQFENTSTNASWQINGSINDTFVITETSTDLQEFILGKDGSLTVLGDIKFTKVDGTVISLRDMAEQLGM